MPPRVFVRVGENEHGLALGVRARHHACVHTQIVDIPDPARTEKPVPVADAERRQIARPAVRAAVGDAAEFVFSARRRMRVYAERRQKTLIRSDAARQIAV